MEFSSKFLNDFEELIDSLKLAQRAELRGKNDEELIEKLYTDPLPNNTILKKVCGDNTVFLVGRKGTGKSTIFARAQYSLRKNKEASSVYIDVRSLYGKSISEDIKINSREDVKRKLILLQNFIASVLGELINEIEKELNSKNVLMRLWSKGKYDEVIKALENVKSEINKPEYIDLTLAVDVEVETKGQKKQTSTDKLGAEASINAIGPSMKVNAETVDEAIDFDEEVSKYSKELLRYFSIKDYMDEISTILKKIGIKKIHIFLDDFSEIDFDAQKMFVDVVLEPLNNWSDKFYRFKVAAYPQRIYFGGIDKGKIDEIKLDYYELYKEKDQSKIENKAIDFLERLLINRFKYYFRDNPNIIFNINSANTFNDYLEILFQASMNIPRILGHIFDECYQNSLLYNKLITKSQIEEAASEYYNSRVKYHFTKKDYMLNAFDERLDRYAQEKLIDTFKDKAKELKNVLGKENRGLFKELSVYNTPTSHFYIHKEYEKFLYSLELNYVVNKHNEQSDRDGKIISIYALNLGLCKYENIIFGRPKGHSSFRKYFISRQFNYNKTLENYLLEFKKYRCKNCGTVYDYSEFETVERANGLCFKTCKTSGYIEEELYFDSSLFKDVEVENLLSEIDLDILNTLKNGRNMLYASIIAKELDCTYHLISARVRKLISKGLIKREKHNITGKGKRSIYLLTDKANTVYFSS